MGHRHVGVEHLFLATIRDPHAVPSQVLATAVDLAEVEARLRGVMESAGYKTPTRNVVRPPGTRQDEG
jgi:hypothetical protein